MKLDLDDYQAIILFRFYRAMHVVLARYCYRKSVCLPATLWYREHIGWTSSKLITRYYRVFVPGSHNIGNLVQGEHS